MQYVGRIVAWILVPLLLMRLALMMWATRANIARLPALVSPVEWIIIAAALGAVGWSLHRRLSRRPEPAEELKVALIRLVMDHRSHGITEGAVHHDGFSWLVRVLPRQRTDLPPVFTVGPAPTCPKCSLPVAEVRNRGYWLRSCTSAACDVRRLSHEPFTRAADFIRRAAEEAWSTTAPLVP